MNDEYLYGDQSINLKYYISLTIDTTESFVDQ